MISQAPQIVRQKFNVGEHTKDAVFIDAERRFQELEKETKKLHDESKKYFEAINGMLKHQIEFSQACADIYKPISGRVSDPDSLVPEGNPEGIRACEEYEAIVKELLATLQPELEMIETRVIRPADELLDIIKVIRKTITKRQHKQIDYDRHRASLKKLQDKKEKSLKDEKAMYKAETEVEQATQEFNYFNDLLKDELPRLFQLEREFIRPLFQSFYYMQLNVFYTLHERMQGCDIGYFDLTLGIEEAFEAKRGDIKERAETLSIVKFKTTGAKRPPKYGPGASKLGIEGPTSRLAIEDRKPSTSAASSSIASRRQTTDFTDNPPPPYSTLAIAGAGEPSIGRANSTGGNWGSVAKAKGPAPPPPKPKPSRLSGVPNVETATALYDYEAQAEGDLSFTTGDVIEIVLRTQNDNEWWTGKCRGRTGQFPCRSKISIPSPLPSYQ
jgi:amphiphysin